MLRRTMSLAAVAVTVIMAAAIPAGAGSPCCCAMPCVVPAPAPVIVYQPYEMPQIYVVDQGPVYSGPGIFTNPTVVLPRRMPKYPYVGHDYPRYLPSYEELPPYQEPLPLRSRAQALPPRRLVKRAQAR